MSSSFFDISTYKHAALAGGLFWLLNTQTATDLVHNIVGFVNEDEKNRDATKRDSTVVSITKAIIGVLAYRFVGDFLFSDDEDLN